MRWDTARATAFIALTSMAAACGGGDGAPPSDQPEQARPAADAGTTEPPAAPPAGAAPTDQIQQGQQIFAGAGLCVTCHGTDATGTPLGPNLTDGTWLWIDTDAGDVQTQIATIVRTGVSLPKEYPAPMPAMGGGQLDEDQVQAVAAYIHSLNPQGG